MAQAFQKLGATITVVHPWQHYFLQHDDPDLTTILKDLKKSGMEFHFVQRSPILNLLIRVH
jgi:pyruvate/2-oxoglutarate dehydrogenase complex dihydrolipoamide dehydrogenase (E3) component